MFIWKFLLTIANTITSQIIDVFSWIILYTGLFRALRMAYMASYITINWKRELVAYFKAASFDTARCFGIQSITDYKADNMESRF
jgi:hypothetical protein